MNIPLHYQISEYDCVPTAFVNAISYLFNRREVPPMVIRTIHMYSLDTVGRQARLGTGGTSRAAVRLLGEWLTSYKFKDFSVYTEFLEEEEVHLRKNSKILSCLEEQGVALCNILLHNSEEHYLMAIQQEDGWMYCFDPYYRTVVRGRGMKNHVRQLESADGRTPNLAVRVDWMDQQDSRKRFCLGPVEKRECLLIWRDRGVRPQPPELPEIPII